MLLGFLFTEEPRRGYLAQTPLESGAGIWWERGGHEYIMFHCEWLGPSMNTLLTAWGWMWGEKSYSRSLWRASLGQRQKLDGISAWTSASSMIEIPGLVLPEWGTPTAAVNAKSLPFSKPLHTLLQPKGIYILQTAYIANLAFCLPFFKNNLKKYWFQLREDIISLGFCHLVRYLCHIYLLLLCCFSV